MFKILILALAIASVAAQEAPAGGEAAPEPYSYGYETDSHSASEQRDPSGKVTGFYTIADADGRQRRVEYFADASGFHAKVQTNEVGTESKNSADVEVLASPPTAEQFVVREQQQQVYQAQPQVQKQQSYSFVQQAPPQQQQQQVTTTTQFAAAPQQQQQVQRASYSYVQGQPQYGYYPAGYGYYGNAAYGGQYGSQYGAQDRVYSSYNNHLPSQYYKSLTTQTVQQPGQYVVGQAGGATGGLVGRYVTTTQTVQPQVTSYGSGSYQTYGGPAQQGYSSGGVTRSSYSRSSSSSSSSGSPNPQGSSNYIVLKKRASDSQ